VDDRRGTAIGWSRLVEELGRPGHMGQNSPGGHVPGKTLRGYLPCHEPECYVLCKVAQVAGLVLVDVRENKCKDPRPDLPGMNSISGTKPHG
jgi:hypothetical protein